MKRYAAILASILAVVGIVTAVFAVIGRGQKMQVPFNKRDFPKHGLHIIAPTDPTFESTASNYFQGKSSKRLESLKPFSVFIKNSGNKMVVAYALTWKFIRPDGRVISKTVGYSEPGILMGNEIGPGTKHTTAIEPASVRCFSWNSQIEQQDAVEGSAGPDESSVSYSQGNREDNSSTIKALLSSELSQATGLTVSLDGVVFEDGTFVGSDATFFQQLQATVNAKIDLLREVEMASKRGEIDQALESIAAKSLEPDVVFASEFSADDYYRYFQKVYAAEITNMNRAYGKEKLVPHLVKSYRRARPILRKE